MKHSKHLPTDNSSSNPMAHPLYLTSDERKVFDSLPDAVREGWKIEEENFIFEDTDEKRRARLVLMRLHDPILLEFQKKAQHAASPQALAELMNTIDLAALSSDDMAELFFAIGPSSLTVFISGIWENMVADKDMEMLAAMTGIRHGLLDSMQPSA